VDFNFKLDDSKCIGCGVCAKACLTDAILINEYKKPYMKDIGGKIGWQGCLRCQRCMAICPTGAISILGKNPNNSYAITDCATPEQLEALIACRRTCRSYQHKQVDKALIARMLKSVSNAPNGSCNQLVEFTIIDDIDVMDSFRKMAYDQMVALALRGIYPHRFSKGEYEQMKTWENTKYDGDMLFATAPHLLVAHAPINRGEWITDVNIALAYFELLLAANGLGSIYLGFAMAAFEVMPEIKAKLNIPENHFFSSMLGFGFPNYKFKRGVQRDGVNKINIIENI
jgi:ferredoxin